MQGYREQIKALQKEQSEFGVGSYEWNLFEEAIKGYEQGYIDAQIGIKDAIKSRYEFEFDMMDKAVAESQRISDKLQFESGVLNTATDGKDFKAQMEYSSKIVDSYTDSIKLLEEEVKTLIESQAKHAKDSSYWNGYKDKIRGAEDAIDDLNASMIDSLANSKELAKGLLQSQFDESNKNLEKQLFGGSSSAEKQDVLNKEKEDYETYLRGLEKQYAIEMLIQDVRKEGISQFDSQINAMQSSEKISKRELELLKKKIDIKKYEVALEKLKGQRTIKTLIMKDDGSADWEYSADEDALLQAEQQITQARIDLINFDKQMQFEDRQKEIDTKLDFLNRVIKVQEKALEDEYKTAQEFENAMNKVGIDFKEYATDWGIHFTSFSDTFTIMTEAQLSYTNTVATLTTEIQKLVASMEVMTSSISQAKTEQQSYEERVVTGKDGEKIIKRIPKFDTGGYTGDFSGGKLAVLHEKELVLKEGDTKNFLDGMKFLKGISFSGISSLIGKISNKGNGNNDISQDIKIYAEFPNATNQDEIRKAIMSLPSSAIVKANTN